MSPDPGHGFPDWSWPNGTLDLAPLAGMGLHYQWAVVIGGRLPSSLLNDGHCPVEGFPHIPRGHSASEGFFSRQISIVSEMLPVLFLDDFCPKI